MPKKTQTPLMRLKHAISGGRIGVVKRILDEDPSLVNATYSYRGRSANTDTITPAAHASLRNDLRCLFEILKRGGRIPEPPKVIGYQRSLEKKIEESVVVSLGDSKTFFHDSDLVKKEIKERGSKRKVPPLAKPGTTENDLGIVINPNYIAFCEILAYGRITAGAIAYSKGYHNKETKERIEKEATELVLRSEGKWKDLAATLSATHTHVYYDIKDTLAEVSAHLVLPFILHLLGKTGVEAMRDLEVTEAKLARQHRYTPPQEAFVAQHNFETHMVLFGDQPIHHIAKLSEQWHKHRKNVLGRIREIKVTEKGWHPLIEEVEIKSGAAKGYRIVPLTSEKALQAEGDRMNHCINGAGFAASGLQGNSHYFSIQDGMGTKESTLEIRYNPQEKEARAVQHRARGDGTPSPKARAAADWLIRNINNSRLKTSWKLGETKESKRLNSLLPFYKACGMKETTSPLKYLDRAFEALKGRIAGEEGVEQTNILRFRNAHLIPPKYHDMDGLEFMVRSGLGKAALDVFPYKNIRRALQEKFTRLEKRFNSKESPPADLHGNANHANTNAARDL